jgi:hypothetical protein
MPASQNGNRLTINTLGVFIGIVLAIETNRVFIPNTPLVFK